MRTIKWSLSIGYPGAERSGEFEVDDDTSEEDIEDLVRDEVFNFTSWGWKYD